jgi:hypothetical protein
MKREKRLTKRERKAMSGGGPHEHEHRHIHCIACGRHLEPEEFELSPPTAMLITCEHRSQFPCCIGCEGVARYLVAEHDKSGKPVNAAPAYH